MEMGMGTHTHLLCAAEQAVWRRWITFILVIVFYLLMPWMFIPLSSINYWHSLGFHLNLIQNRHLHLKSS